MPTVNIEGVGKVKIEATPGTPEFDAAIDDIRATHGGFAKPKGMRFTGGAQPAAAMEQKRAAGEQSIREGKETLASMLPALGAAAGVAATGGMGAIPMIAGATLGGGGAEAYKQLASHAMGLEAPQSSLEAGKRILKEGAIQGGMQSLGAVATAATGRLINIPWSRLVAKTQLPENQEVIRAAKNLGVELTIPEVIGSRPLKGLQHVADKSLFGSGKAMVRQKAQYDATLKSINETLETLASPVSPAQMGAASKDAFEVAKKAIERNARANYQEAEKLIPATTPVSLKSAQKLLNEHIAQGKAAAERFPSVAAKSAKFKQFATEIDPSLAGAPKGGIDISQFPPEVQAQINAALQKVGAGTATWEETRGLISELKSISRLDQTVPEDLRILSKRLIKPLQQSLDEAAGKVSPEALKAWKAADAFYRETKDLTERTVVARLMETDPSVVLKSIKTVEDVKAVKETLLKYAKDKGVGEKAWKMYQRERAQGYLADPHGTGDIDLGGLQQRLKNVGPDVLAEEFGGDTAGRQMLQTLRDVATVSQRVDGLLGSRAGKAAAEVGYDTRRALYTAGTAAAGKDATGVFRKLVEGTGGLASTYLVGRTLANPAMAKQLIGGMKLLPYDWGKGVTQIERALETIVRSTVAATKFAKGKSMMERSH